jgi:DNA-binding response OmpR family regulator
LIQSGDLTLDTASQKVFLNDREVGVSEKEFALLLALVQRKGQTVTLEWLLENIFPEGDKREVLFHIKWLREKIETGPSISRIITVRGVGYRFDG